LDGAYEKIEAISDRDFEDAAMNRPTMVKLTSAPSKSKSKMNDMFRDIRQEEIA